MNAVHAALKTLLLALALAIATPNPAARAGGTSDLFVVSVAERYGYIDPN